MAWMRPASFTEAEEIETWLAGAVGAGEGAAAALPDGALVEVARGVKQDFGPVQPV